MRHCYLGANQPLKQVSQSGCTCFSLRAATRLLPWPQPSESQAGPVGHRWHWQSELWLVLSSGGCCGLSSQALEQASALPLSGFIPAHAFQKDLHPGDSGDFLTGLARTALDETQKACLFCRYLGESAHPSRAPFILEFLIRCFFLSRCGPEPGLSNSQPEGHGPIIIPTVLIGIAY